MDVLGPLRLCRGPLAVHIGSTRQRVLLLRMIVGRGQVSSGALVEALWGASPPPSARSTLKSHASNLRATLGEVGVGLRSHRGGYELVLDPMNVDAYQFERLCREARELAAPEALEQMTTALALWRGHAFAEVRHELFAIPEATRLEELRLQAIERLAELKLGLGRHHEVVADLEPVVCQHPFREPLHARLILALYRCGRQADALRLHASLRARLRDELGIDPSAELDQLQLAILRHGEEIAAPGVSGDPGRMTASLPSPIGPLIGRAEDVREVVSTFEDHRLVVLTGPGGIGKTRVAIAAAHELATGLPGGPFFVDLSVVRDDASVAAFVASTVAGSQVDRAGDIVRNLCSWLSERELLLVLDNCEHLLQAAADVVERLLLGCPGLRVLATSREPLGVPGEVRWPVPALPVRAPPGSHEPSPAVCLFVERARAVRPSFRMVPTNEQSLVDICASLDGLPLAIELAAARISHLAPAQIAGHLAGGHTGFLVDETRQSARHRALDVAITWSVDLLDESQRRLFFRLSVFAGEFSLAAVEAICTGGPVRSAAVMDTLAALVRKSLVVTLDRGDVVHYRLLDTLRRFGADELRAVEDVGHRLALHARWYLQLAEEAEPHLRGQDEADWLNHLQQEYGNLQAALRWLLDNDRFDDALRFAASLRRFWRARGYVSDGREWLRKALAMAVPRVDPHRGTALHAAGWLAREQGDYAEAHTLFNESLRIHRRLDNAAGIGWALVDLGFLARYEAEYVAARTLFEESIGFLRRAGESEGLAAALGNLGQIARDQGDLATAETNLSDSLALFREVGDRVGAGWALTALGMVARADGRGAEARTRLEEALSIWQQLDDHPNTANAMSILAAVARDEGRLDEAHALLRASLRTQRDLGDRRGMAFTLEGFAILVASRGDGRGAATFAAAAQAVRDEIHAPAPPTWSAELAVALQRSRSTLGPPTIATPTTDGGVMSLAEAVSRAMALETGESLPA